MQFFKVYVDGKSPYVHADMPEIGEWTEEKEPEMCQRGWYVTTRPDKYRHGNWDGMKTYLCEGRGNMKIEEDKVSFQQIKIIQEITPEWEYLEMYPYVKVVLAAIWRREHKDDDLPSWADLSGAILSGANLFEADLSKANLTGADLFGADLTGADLSGADLTGADLSGAYLSGANLFGANLSKANLTGADLSGADLTGADLSGADLTGANLSKANLFGTHGVKGNPVFSEEQQQKAHC